MVTGGRALPSFQVSTEESAIHLNRPSISIFFAISSVARARDEKEKVSGLFFLFFFSFSSHVNLSD